MLAGALRRRVWIDQGYFQWTPNFYIIFVAPPGIVSKSTTASIGSRLLRQIPDITFGPDAVTWQALTQALADSTQEVLMPDGLGHPMSCITIISSEFGTFLDPSNREMVDVLVSLWDGQIGTWEKSTKTQGSDLVVNPWINIIACTTPSWIAQNFPEYMVGGGFTSRCIWVYGETKRHLVAYPGKHIPKNFEQQAANLVHDLEAISLMTGEYKLSQSAEEWGEQWYTDHYAGRSNTKLDEQRWGGYWARKQTHIHKLAMVLAASESNELVIHKHHLVRAQNAVDYMEQDMPKVFELIGKSQESKDIDLLVRFVQRFQAIDKEILIRELTKSMGIMEINNAITGAVASGLIGMKAAGERVIVFDKFGMKIEGVSLSSDVLVNVSASATSGKP